MCVLLFSTGKLLQAAPACASSGYHYDWSSGLSRSGDKPEDKLLPPPLLVTVTWQDDHCGYNDGEITIEVSNGCYPFYLEVKKAGTSVKWTYYTTSAPLPINQTAPGLSVGKYIVSVTDGCGSSFQQIVYLDDDALWPLNPLNDWRILGIDIITDNESNVYATGHWEGSMQLQPPTSQTFNSNDQFNIYLVKLDACGKIFWEVVVGKSTGDCFVKAIEQDATDRNILITGEYTDGTIVFPGPAAYQLTNNTTSKEAFLAKFSKDTGHCLWVSKISCNNGPNTGLAAAEAVTSDELGNIFVFGDFSGNNLYLYEPSGNLIITLNNSGPGNSDNYLAVYSTAGLPLIAKNILMSSIFDDQAFGIDCMPSHSVQNNTEVYITGDINQFFLCQRWNHDGSTLSLMNEYFLASQPGNQNYTGKSIVCFDHPNGYVGFAVSGWKTYWGGQSLVQHPFLATAHIFPWPVPPGWVQVDGLYEFVNLSASTNNFSTDVTMNISNFDLYMAGCINQDGWHPLINSGMPNPIYYPQTAPVINDFFIDKFSYVPGLFSDIEWGCWAVSNSGIFSLYADEPPFMAMASDNGYKLFFTGSYVDNLQTPPAVGLNISNQSVTGCYVARLIETGSDPVIKKEPLGNLFSAGNSNHFSLFPNPCREMITLVKEELSNNPCLITFYSVNGKPMDAKLVSEQPGYNCFDLRTFPPGLYCVHILSGSKAQVLKFVRI